MRWHKTTLRVVNRTKGTVIGDAIRVADSELTRIVGLLGERRLLPGDGLLIVPSQGVHTVGMLFPIDVVVLDGEWNVVAVRRELRPCRMTRFFWKAAAVLELPAGIIDSTGTLVGDSLEFVRAGAAQAGT
jgi:uncharacterized membrane protein (UPF0127 family)